MSKTRRAIYPGSFNPIHDGHIDIIKRASKLFDEVIVVVSNNFKKQQISSLDERAKQVEKVLKKLKLTNVLIKTNNKLTVRFAKQFKCQYIVRGIRNKRDKESEIELAKLNNVLDPSIETVIFITKKELTNISSTKIRELNKKITKLHYDK